MGRASVASGWLIIFIRGVDEILDMKNVQISNVEESANYSPYLFIVSSEAGTVLIVFIFSVPWLDSLISSGRFFNLAYRHRILAARSALTSE